MTAATGIAVAVTFLWLGMVLAISFLEAPIKFRAPGVTLPIGLGIGRLVFRALNTCEVVFAVVLVIVGILDPPGTLALVALGAAIVLLAGQLLAIRPALTRRSNAVLTGEDAPRSRRHHAYVGLEILKVAALVVGGIALL